MIVNAEEELRTLEATLVRFRETLKEVNRLGGDGMVMVREEWLLRIKELETKYGRPIEFRVVDTGGAFRGKGRSRIDVCVKNKTASFDATINGTLHIDIID